MLHSRLDARTALPAQHVGDGLRRERKGPLERSDRPVPLTDRRLYVLTMQLADAHMIDPKVRDESSDNPRSRGRQSESSDNEVGARIQSELAPRKLSWLAREAGLAESTVSDAIKRGPSRSDVAIRLARALDVTTDWLLTGEGRKERGAVPDPVLTEVRATGLVGFDELKSDIFGDRPLPALPLYGSAEGGALEEDFALTEVDVTDVLDHLRRPLALADDQESYALTIVGDSMSPRFEPGERVGVSPRARVEIGDDVIVQLRGPETNRVHRVLIKKLVRRNATHIVLKQHNPVKELRIETRSILAMHKVKGHFL